MNGNNLALTTKFTCHGGDARPPQRLQEPLQDCFEIQITGRLPAKRCEDSFQDYNKFTTDISFKCPKGYNLLVSHNERLTNAGYEMTPTIVPDKEKIVVNLKKYKDVENLQLPFQGLVCRLVPKVHSLLHFNSVASSAANPAAATAAVPFSAAAASRHVPTMKSSSFAI